MTKNLTIRNHHWDRFLGRFANGEPFPAPLWRALGLMLFALLLPLAAGAENGDVTLAGQCGGPCTAAAMAGHYAYIGEGLGLSILDVADPAHPALVGRVLLPKFKDFASNVVGVAVSGNFAYAVNGCSLQIIDISDPAAPTLRGNVDSAVSTSDRFVDVAVAGTYAYVAAREGGLKAVDISNPDLPQLKNTFATADWCLGVAVAGNRAYLAEQETGLQVVDVSDPATSLVKTGQYNTPGSALNVTVAGNYAYVADGEGGLQILDVSTADPTPKGAFVTADRALDVAVYGTNALVATRLRGLQMVSVANPAAPTLLAAQDTPGIATAIALGGSIGCLADTAGVWCMDLAHLSGSPGVYLPPYQPTDVAVKGDLAYVASSSGLNVISAADAAKPVQLGRYDLPAPARNIAVSGNTAYVSDTANIYQRAGAKGLWLLNVSTPNAPTLLGSYATTLQTNRLIVQSSTAYLAGNEGLELVNVSNPAQPALLAKYSASGEAYDMAVIGNLVYLAGGAAGLHIINVSDPASPTLVTTYTGAGAVYGITTRMSGKQLIVTAQTQETVTDVNQQTSTISKNWLTVLDLTAPTAPTLVESTDSFGDARSLNILASMGDLMLAGRVFGPDTGDYLEVSYPLNPSQTTPLSKILMGGETARLATTNTGLIFSADSMGGLVIMQTDPPAAAWGVRFSAWNLYH